ncbi:MAG: FtsX-like permease family protein [Wenzhouxiangellaceae bacterium]
MITEISHFANVQDASVISRGPWRFRGLERVSGPFIQAFGVGPDIAATMELDGYRGRDFSWADMTSGQAQAFQNISSQTRQMMSRFGPEIALLEGLRWDPLEPEMPRLLFKPITEILPGSFELIWRGNPETLLSSDQLTRLQQAWPEAVLDRPVVVADVIQSRYSALLNLQRLSGLVLVASLLVAFMLTGATLAQLLVHHQRALAIRVALGATPRQALGPLLGRVLVTLTLGAAVGVFAAWIMGRAISALIEQYQSQWLLSAMGVALVVASVGAMAVAFAIWKLRRLDLQALLSDL